MPVVLSHGAALYRDETDRPLPEQLADCADTWIRDARQHAALRRLPDMVPDADLLMQLILEL